jgi:CBS domain-containing protein
VRLRADGAAATFRRMEQAGKERVSPASGVPHTLEQLTVADAMSAGVISCSPETRLTAVARLMATHRVHAVFVFEYGDEADEDVRLWGVVSDLDLAAAVAGGVLTRTARESSVTPLLTVHSGEPLARAAELIAQRGVTHLAVLDVETGRPVGVLSTLDIARAVSGLDRERAATRMRPPA